MDMTLSDYDGRTALHLAAAEGHFECVQFLVEQCNVPCNPKDRYEGFPSIKNCRMLIYKKKHIFHFQVGSETC